MLRVFTAFSGYDSQCMALDGLGLDYELAGNSIVVDVLTAIFRKLFIDTGNDDAQMTIFDIINKS